MYLRTAKLCSTLLNGEEWIDPPRNVELRLPGYSLMNRGKDYTSYLSEIKIYSALCAGK